MATSALAEDTPAGAVMAMISRTISHYEILDRLGEGGMGTVYRAVDTRLDRPVAVKLLREESTASNENKQRFVQEAKAASALNHPHIVTIYDIGQDEGVDFIAMEYVVGASLAQLLASTKLSVSGARVRSADRRCAGHRSRRGDRASRSQARQHHGQ